MDEHENLTNSAQQSASQELPEGKNIPGVNAPRKMRQK